MPCQNPRGFKLLQAETMSQMDEPGVQFPSQRTGGALGNSRVLSSHWVQGLQEPHFSSSGWPLGPRPSPGGPGMRHLAALGGHQGFVPSVSRCLTFCHHLIPLCVLLGLPPRRPWSSPSSSAQRLRKWATLPLVGPGAWPPDSVALGTPPPRGARLPRHPALLATVEAPPQQGCWSLGPQLNLVSAGAVPPKGASEPLPVPLGLRANWTPFPSLSRRLPGVPPAAGKARDSGDCTTYWCLGPRPYSSR